MQENEIKAKLEKVEELLLDLHDTIDETGDKYTLDKYTLHVIHCITAWTQALLAKL